MTRFSLPFVASILFLATVAMPARATSWAAVPLEVLVDEADLIVAGKVTKIQDGGFAVFNRKFDVAVVEVSGVLKTLSGKPKEVHIAQPAGRQTRTDFYSRTEQEGIWLLTKDPERNVYWISHPSQFQQEKEQQKLKAIIESRAKAFTGKAVNGLVAWAGAFETRGLVEVRFGLKNVTEKPIIVCDYLGNQPLKVQWIGPNGNVLQSNHYAWLKNVPTKEDKTDFVVIPPGGVRYIGPRGKMTGITYLSSALKPGQNEDVAPPGNNRITVSYANSDNGKQFGLENVWTGTVTANEVSFTGR